MSLGPGMPTEEYFNKGTWGYDGTLWRKLPMLWGYSESWRERKQNLSCAAGANSLLHTAVSAGEVWVLESISVFNVQTDCTYIRIYITSGVMSYIFKQFSDPALNVPEQYSGRFTFGPGDVLTVTFAGCVLNDDIYSDVVGYKMRIS